jgi:hypothetical protein
VGRQGVVKEFRFTPDDWIELVEDRQKGVAPAKISDAFTGNALMPTWQWSVFQTPDHKVKGGKIELTASSEKPGTFIGQKIFSDDFQAQVTVFTDQSSSAAGLAIIGDEKNLISATVQSGKIKIVKIENDIEMVIMEKDIDKKPAVHLRVNVRNGKDIHFASSADGKKFNDLNENPLDGFYLPPWDRAIRVALISRGTPNQRAVFDDFILENQ